MKKSILVLCGMLLTSGMAHATNQADLLDVKTYKAEYETAISLYQQKDYTNALPALEVMAQRGEKKAQYILGTMYLNGQGTAQDLMKSYAWLSVANEQKNKHWKRPLNMLNDKLPADYLTIVSEEADKYQALYGVKAQKMKCRNIKTLGSKKPTHMCMKSEVKDGYYYVAGQSVAAN
ncbi:hypothetical protein ACFSJY_14100 [Thalassotalea euphylliae]|uniref:hypothetical protein n=1 Tax=Thalassotalea euphylliae TaxID=1655234 RepID=UPI00362BA3B3